MILLDINLSEVLSPEKKRLQNSVDQLSQRTTLEPDFSFKTWIRYYDHTSTAAWLNSEPAHFPSQSDSVYNKWMMLYNA